MKEEYKELIQAGCVSVFCVLALFVTFGAAIAIIIGIPTAAIILIIETFQKL